MLKEKPPLAEERSVCGVKERIEKMTLTSFLAAKPSVLALQFGAKKAPNLEKIGQDLEKLLDKHGVAFGGKGLAAFQVSFAAQAIFISVKTEEIKTKVEGLLKKDEKAGTFSYKGVPVTVKNDPWGLDAGGLLASLQAHSAKKAKQGE